MFSYLLIAISLTRINGQVPGGPPAMAPPAMAPPSGAPPAMSPPAGAPPPMASPVNSQPMGPPPGAPPIGGSPPKSGNPNKGEYNIGVGIGDITGPSVDIGFFGYAEPSQIGSGIHFRVWARAYVVNDGTNSICFVLCDLGGMSQLVKIKVVEKLKQKYGKTYSADNVLLSATHTHSAPGGHYQYVLYNLASITGFSKENFDAIVNGIMKAIGDAHEMSQKTKGKILFKQDKLVGASANRSPASYILNPKEERSKYSGNTDHTFQLLKFVTSEGKPIGMYSVFAVHGVSMNKTNKLVSGDNKGYASQLFEAKLNVGFLPGRGPYVAAFATGNEGDSSPNIQGAKCQDTGARCDATASTCNGNNQKCYALGPGKDMFESTRLIGEKQFTKAWSMFNSANEQVIGQVDSVYQTVDMSKYEVKGYVSKNKTLVPVDGTCPAAMGFSFAAGTTDGVGAVIFTQGSSTNPFLKVVKPAMKNAKPSKKLLDCQSPKPILLPTGEMKVPYDWQPVIIGTQILKLGQIYLVALPAEFTTMSGRRVRDAVMAQLPPNSKVMLVGLSNAYTGYVVTPEEYELQRYEAASTAYGINTLNAYVKQFSILAKNIKEGTKPPPGPPIPNLMSKQISLTLPVVIDTLPQGKKFGDVLIDSKPSYSKGSRVMVKFAVANPRNSKQGSTFLTVDKLDGTQWKTVADDANWETVFYLNMTVPLIGPAEGIVLWTIPKNTIAGDYRICHYGVSKSVGGKNQYQGCSKTFKVA